MAKTRWNKIRARIKRGSDNFQYAGDGNGKLIFYRGNKPFDWEPIAVDREAAKAFVDRMNGLRGSDIERLGRPLSEQFIKTARKAAFAATVEQMAKDRTRQFAETIDAAFVGTVH